VKINAPSRPSLFRTFFLFSLFFVLSCAAPGGIYCQDDPPAVPASTPEHTKSVEILTKAAPKQGGDDIVADLKNFRAFFNLAVFDPDKGKINFKVERLFDDHGTCGRMWTKKKHDDSSAKYSTLVHDGEEAWRIGHDGVVAIFTDKPDAYKTDLKNLEDDLRLTRQMFRFFFVRTLLEELDELSLVGESHVRGRDVYRIEGKTSAWLGDENKTLVYLVIHVDRKDFTVNEVELIDLSIKERRRLFVFTRYNRNAQGVLVPGNVKIFTKSTEHWDMQIALGVNTLKTKTGKKRIQKIDFNIPVQKELFEIPE